MENNTTRNEELNDKIFDCLVKLGLNPSHKGFYYLRKMLIVCINCHHMPLLKDICERLSESDNLCGKSIQHAIHYTISKTFKTTNICERISEMLNVKILREDFHPKLLITLLCEHLSRDRLSDTI